MKSSFVLLFALLGCSAAPHAVSPLSGRNTVADNEGKAPAVRERQVASGIQQVTKSTQGDARALVFTSSALMFCDKAGAHRFQLNSQTVEPGTQPCPGKEPVAACQDSATGIETRTPNGGPIDFIDGPDGMSYPQKGLVHDCAVIGAHMLVGTGNNVVLIDTDSHRTRELSKEGSDSIALTEKWAAWATSSVLHLLKLP